MDELKRRREGTLIGGGQDKIDKKHEKGQLTARERVASLFQPDTFQEFGMHVNHSCHNFGMEKKRMPADGVVSGTGIVDGRSVGVVAQDFTIGGGSVGRMHAKKFCDLMSYAVQCGMPIVTINDSGGARIQEGVEALSGYGQIFYMNTYASGVVPQIAIIAGPCAGGAAYSPALMDFIIMTRKNANLFICGPEVIKAATGETAALEQFATADAHASISGNIHFIAEDDQHAIEITKQLLSFLPSNNTQEPPHKPNPQIEIKIDEALNELVPESAKQAFDVKKVIERIVDDANFLEVQANWAKNMVVGFARIEGIVVGIIANQPMIKAGCIDIDASDKAARFIRTCNVFNVPLVNLVDTGGFFPGLRQEQGGIIRHGAKMLFAYSSATVPKITVIMRKAYGGAYLAMCPIDAGADLIFAWPTAEIAVMGAEGAVKVIYGKEIKESANPSAFIAEKEADYRKKFASPYQAAETGMVTDVIQPGQTRSLVALGLRQTLNKHCVRPSKKHGNIPL